VVRVHIERFGNPQVTDLICARICARDEAGRVETGETSKRALDPRRAFAEVSAYTRDGARRQRRLSYCS
jgi:hypothetical protein